jgi:hypothetical protein
MSRSISLFFCCSLYCACALAQTSPSVPTSDPIAVALARKSIAALTGGVSINDVTLNATVISILGPQDESGTATFQAKGTLDSRTDLSLPSGTRSDVRNTLNGTPGGSWVAGSPKSTAYATHNCFTDAVWFFPALSSLSQTTNPNVVFQYVGQEQHAGVNALHIKTYVGRLGAFSGLERLTALDFYLDPLSSLPLAIAFSLHPDNDMNIDIPSEIRFANYQSVSGAQVPFHFQRMLNGGVTLDVNVTGAAINTGLQDSLFTLQ